MPQAPRDHGGVSAATLLAVCLATIGLAGQQPPAASGAGRISGRVLSSSSEPIPGATVRLVLLPRTGDGIASWTTTTAGDGTYRFEWFAEGPYTVTLDKPGYADAILSLTENVGAGFSRLGSGNQRVDLQRDGDASEIIGAVRRRGRTLENVVLSRGELLDDVEVVISRGKRP